MRFLRLALLALFALVCGPASAQYPGWPESGSLFLNTTPEGADLPATAVLESVPVLVRLHGDSFDFTRARAHGEDLRFVTLEGQPLAYQIESWDAARGEAAVWVRVPKITGNARQELRVFWGNPEAQSESSGAAVFGHESGYAGVCHLGETVADETGTLLSKEVGLTRVPGVIGEARHFAGKEGVFGGDKIEGYPTGAGAHSTEAWFRAEAPNATILAWGNEAGGRGSKVRMQLRGPAHVHIDSNFSDVDAPGRLPLREWIHVVHTYANGEGRLYLNGQLAATAKMTLNLQSPARLWLGGWYDNYDFVGDLDEVRISEVARSPDWIRLEYENQKPLQTLVGPVVRGGSAFSVSPAQLTLRESESASVTAQAGGAQKVYWILKREGAESVVAVDRLSYRLDAGRVQGDTALVLQCKAIHADGTRVSEIPVTIHEAIPDPVVTLPAPASWDGRTPLELRPVVQNLEALQAAGAPALAIDWKVNGGAVSKAIVNGALVLTRSQYTGRIIVEARVGNGGAVALAQAAIDVTEPAHDAWATRLPDDEEKPADHQFYARDEQGEGEVRYHGTLYFWSEGVYLKLYEGDRLLQTVRQPSSISTAYSLSVKLQPGLVRYRTEFGVTYSGVDTLLHTADDLVCGDAYIIAGQSNAVADVKDNPEDNEWIRSFGNMSGGNGQGWTHAVRGSVSGDLGRIGYWGFDLAQELVGKYRVPICIINGAVGGTRVDQHQPNPADHADPQTIYGRLHARLLAAHLTHGVRALLWYQGENNQGAASPTGDEDWKTYQSYFLDLSAAWKHDYPNLRRYYVFQFWPNSCGMGGTHAGDMTGEVIRTLPRLYSNMRIMSVLGIVSPGSGFRNCHFAWQGYAQVARLIAPVIERDFYGLQPEHEVTAPNLRGARFTNAAQTELALEFDQPMTWNDATKALLYLDDTAAPIRTGRAAGNIITLELTAASSAEKVTYLNGKEWDGTQGNLLYGENKIAALTFCHVPIAR